MVDAPLPALLQAVRRALWRDSLLQALRVAAVAAAAGCAVVAAWHLAVAALPLAVLGVLLLAPWPLALAWAAGQRPDDARCARHADRHLGGASGYATWLEHRGAPPTPALAHLQQWAAARAAGSLQALAAQRRPAGLARPLAALGLCTALAGFVLTRPGVTVNAPAVAAAPAMASAAEPIANAAPAPDLAGELARALRADRETEASRRSGAAAGDGRASDAARPSDLAPTAGAGAGPAAPGSAAEATAGAAPPGAPAAVVAAGVPAGRDAGDSRDDGGPGRSRAAPSGTPPRGAAAPASRGGETIADATRAGRFGGAEVVSSAPAAPVAFAPAAPPTTTDSPLLSPAQARYVQAWRQAQR